MQNYVFKMVVTLRIHGILVVPLVVNENNVFRTVAVETVLHQEMFGSEKVRH